MLNKDRHPWREVFNSELIDATCVETEITARERRFPTGALSSY